MTNAPSAETSPAPVPGRLKELFLKAAALGAAHDRLRAGLEAVEASMIAAQVRVRAEVELPSGGRLAWQRNDMRWGLYVLPMLPPFKPTHLSKASRKILIESAMVFTQLLDRLSATIVEQVEQCETSATSVEMALSWLNRGSEP